MASKCFRYSRLAIVVLPLLLVWLSIRRPILAGVTSRNEGAERVKNAPILLSEREKSIQIAMFSYMKYGDAASELLNRKRSRFDKLSMAHRSLADTIGYSQHFQTADRSVQANADFAERVAANARDIYGLTLPATDILELSHEDVFQVVDDAFGHLVRDWSRESRTERSQVFPPILDALKRHLANVREETRILVPGFGLGRLAHEIVEQGRP
jgi:hypothetical protein